MNRLGTPHYAFLFRRLFIVLSVFVLVPEDYPFSYSLCDTLPIAATTSGIMTSIPPTLVAMRVKCPSQFGDPSLNVWRRRQGTL
jgi:hypothetical protein